MNENNDSAQKEKQRHVLRELDEKMREFSNEREKLNRMSTERIALGRSLTDGEILKQNGTCSDIGLVITKLQDMLEEFEGEHFEE